MEKRTPTDKPRRRIDSWTGFLISIGCLTTLVILGIFILAFVRSGQKLESRTLARARAHFQNIVVTRAWNAEHGGVYVVKRPGIASNPYLDNPDITDDRGRTLTLRNPALMTRKISEISDEHGILRYNITSLRPLNPDNKPDAFETQALRQFEEQGRKEAFTVQETDGRYMFRYMGPLHSAPACLKCHADQAFWKGDIRGGISVSFDITEEMREARRDKYLLAGMGAGATILLLASLILLTRRLMHRIEHANATIRTLSITDELTGLYNRRHIMNRLHEEARRCERYGVEACVAIMDLDFFKQVNDNHGHIAGDAVLRDIAALLRRCTRSSDIVARYGGEEFLILLTDTSLDNGMSTAHKIRKQISGTDFQTPSGRPLRITASLGVSSFAQSTRDGRVKLDILIHDADRALYKAKKDGRNRACSILECH